MRININNSVFDEEEPNVLVEDEGTIDLEERNWYLNNQKAEGIVKDIRLDGAYFLSYKLEVQNKKKLLISSDDLVFKLHFEFDEDVKYQFLQNKDQYIEINKGTYELLFLSQYNKQIVDHFNSKKSIEIFFEEFFLKEIAGQEFNQLLSDIQHREVLLDKTNNSLQEGVFITDEINAIINEINNCNYLGFKRKVFLRLKIKELIIVAMTTYESSYKKTNLLEQDVKSLQDVEEYIKTNLKKDLTISELAILAGLNTSKLKKSFKKVYGTTIFKYITSIRIEKAKELILKEKYTISEASYEVGYKNPQHFTVAFKKKLGYLPSQLKK
ncbi:helix-turn-helix domain-containing protein [Wenyingzhuangia marina]|uniref:AraC-type DNA-binding protein n=1 Tax=Wenyingzhuangia marina TaxID=1195760 RepID=A0A1M5T5N1_9FLAO|nr:AraC family transcriptional regulator [Wenyingzhuangia marina]GGF65458.1 hypothetical protein GCM10011397_05610 [Wenyingzhuangia marina]SHH46012.1 AraC-type DNA-binding protein [Wenyingzhuangia marina]